MNNDNNGPETTSEVVTMPMFPLASVLFPGAPLPLHVFEPRYRQLVADVMTTDRAFGVVLISRGSEVGGGDQRLDIGTLVDIEGLSQLDDGQFALLARGTQRIRIKRWLEDDPYPRAEIERLPEDLRDVDAGNIERTLATIRYARALLSELHDTPPLPTDLDISSRTPSELIDAHWLLCSVAPFDAFDRQQLLEATSVRDRLDRLASLCGELARDVTAMLALGVDDEEDGE